MAAESSKDLPQPVNPSQDLPLDCGEGLPRGPSKSLRSILIQTGSEKGPTLMYVLPQDQKPYQCGFCDMCFDVVRDLYNHVNVHLSTNPYKCGYCKASYKTNFSLTVHVKTHKLFLCLPQSRTTTHPNEDDIQNGQSSNSSIQSDLDIRSIQSISRIHSDCGIENSHSECPDQKDSLDSAVKQTAPNQKYVLLVDEGELYPSKSKVLSRSANTGELIVEDRPKTASARSDSPEDDQTMHEELTGSSTKDKDIGNTLEMCVQYDIDSDNDVESEPFPPDCQKGLKTSASEKADTAASTNRMVVHIDSLLARNSEITQMTSSSSDFKPTSFQKKEDSEENTSELDYKDVDRRLRGYNVRNMLNLRTMPQVPSTEPVSTNVSQIGRQAPAKKKNKKRKKSGHTKGQSKPAPPATYEQYGTLKPFACSLCGDKFGDPKQVSEHFRGVHKIGKDQILLPDLGKDQEDSDKGNAIHDENDSQDFSTGTFKSNCFMCPVCERPFKFCQDLIQHIELTHENDLRPFQCGMCRRRFKQTAHLRDHFDAFHGSGLTRAKRLKLGKSTTTSADNLNQHASVPFLYDGTSSGPKDSSDIVFKKETDTTHTPDSIETGHGKNSFSGDLVRHGSEQKAVAQISASITDGVAGAESTSMFADQSHLWPPETGEDKADISQSLQHTVPEPNTLAMPFLCTFCKEGFEDVKFIRFHVQSVHKFDKNQAATANPGHDIFSDKETAGPVGDNSGQEKSHSFSKLIRCYVCEKAFKLRQDLARHVLTDHGEKEIRIFECSLCGGMFKRGHYMGIHFKTCHDDSFSSHQCPQCGKKFPVLYQLTRHEKTCSLTRNSQKTSSDLGGQGVVKDDIDKATKDHGKATKAHRSGKRRSDICYICGTMTHQLQQHIKIHQSVGSYQCRFCSKTFRHRSVLHKHLNLHTHEKSYVCDTCGKSFATLYSWKIHRNTHTNERPYKCELCGRGFNAMSHLGVHRMRHYQDKRYQCDKCERKFYTKTNLKKHALTHTDLRPFCCKECGKTYRCWGSLKYHKDHKHPSG